MKQKKLLRKLEGKFDDSSNDRSLSIICCHLKKKLVYKTKKCLFQNFIFVVLQFFASFVKMSVKQAKRRPKKAEEGWKRLKKAEKGWKRRLKFEQKRWMKTSGEQTCQDNKLAIFFKKFENAFLWKFVFWTIVNK